ncbi:MAG: outer membrane beta-barrel protein [Desulfuromonadaceae bacterium]|nr:outer membrane beta-barrel protein [Desulfuromonadaceae bacterium]
MNCRLFRAVSAIIAGIMVAGPMTSLADDAISHLSLGHDRFTLAVPDPKVPLPSVFGAKYGFSGDNGFRSYFGTGLAYTLLPEVRQSDSLKIKTGVAAQVGTSYQLGGNSSLTLDYKYLHISPDAQQRAAPPQSIGIGVNIKF